MDCGQNPELLQLFERGDQVCRLTGLAQKLAVTLHSQFQACRIQVLLTGFKPTDVTVVIFV
jgi:hypothetical protein